MGQDVVVEVDATSIGVGLDVERPRPLTKHSVASRLLERRFRRVRHQARPEGARLPEKEGGATFPPFSGRGLPRSLTLAPPLFILSLQARIYSKQGLLRIESRR